MKRRIKRFSQTGMSSSLLKVGDRAAIAFHRSVSLASSRVPRRVAVDLNAGCSR